MRNMKLIGLICVFLAVGIAIGVSQYGSFSTEKEGVVTDTCPRLNRYPTSQSNIIWTGNPSVNGMAQNNGAVVRQNFIDDYIFDKMEADSISYAGLSSDEEFLRRIYLDLTGRIPTADMVDAFHNDPSPDKRTRKIDELLAGDAFTDKLTLFLGDLLGATSNGLNNNGGGVSITGRTKYYNYLRDFVAQGKPYDQLVRELIPANGENFVDGAPNFTARQFYDNAYNDPDRFDELVNITGSAFLGVPLMCINCHDGRNHVEAVNTWLAGKKRQELWGMSAFFAGVKFNRTPVDSQHPNELKFNIQTVSTPGYNTYQGGGIRPARRGRVPEQYVTPRDIFTGTDYALDDNSRATLAELVINNPQFPRATVNYVWAQLMNLGIVDPPGGFDLARDDQASHPELLQALADEFVNSGFDLRHMYEVITKSAAYQLSTFYNGTWQDSYTRYFARHIAKRLEAEQVHDAIVTATGVLPSYKIPQTNEERRDANCGSVTRTVAYAIQLPDPTEPSCNADGGVRGLLNAFDRGNRITTDRKSPPAGSIGQTLGLMNNNFVIQRIRAGTSGSAVNRLLAQYPNDDNGLIDALFKGTLTRLPTDEERQAAQAALAENRTQGAEHLHWALINKLDFLFY